LPAETTDRHVYNRFTVRAKDRDNVKKRSAAAGTGSEIYYPVSLHLQECFRHFRYKAGDFPVMRAGRCGGFVFTR
jgi:dTDP-4-amino-4,6-dideoxygalactose transaminase